MKVVKNGSKAGRRFFCCTHGLSKEPTDRFGNGIKRIFEFLGRHVDTATSQACENITERYVLLDPSGDLTDDVGDPIEDLECSSADRSCNFA